MSAIIPEKCEECEGEYALLPCPFCGRAVTTRFNAMTGKHYISHVELNNTCPQPPFYGEAALWNDRLTENRLRAELDACRIIHKSKNEQISLLIAQVWDVSRRADRADRIIFDPPCAGCGAIGGIGPEHLCDDCAVRERATNVVLEGVLKAKEKKIDELHADIIQQSAEIATLKAECPHSDLRMDTAGLRCMICGKQFVTTQTTITWSGT